jgi:TPR repeat protein
MRRALLALALGAATLSCMRPDASRADAQRRAADEKTLKILRTEAQGGNPDAQYRLGLLYQYGILVPQDFAAANAWWMKAAERGHVEAEYKLAHSYREGRGVTPDPGRAFYWYMRAAQDGDAEAQYNVGYCYVIGYGVARSWTEAAAWYERAAERGDVQARAALANLYANEAFEKFSPAIAYKWLVLVLPRLSLYDASARAEAEALQHRLEGFLSADELEQARRAAADWKLRHPRETLPRPVGEVVVDPRTGAAAPVSSR